MHSFQDYLCFPQLNLHILWAFFSGFIKHKSSEKLCWKDFLSTITLEPLNMNEPIKLFHHPVSINVTLQKTVVYCKSCSSGNTDGFSISKEKTQTSTE